MFRVDVTIDGGKNWTAADLHEKPVKQIRNRQWGWYQVRWRGRRARACV